MATTTVEPKTQTVNTTTGGAPQAPKAKKGVNIPIIAAGSLAAVAVAGWFLISSGDRKEAYAQRELERARAVAETGNIPAASSQFQRIIENFGGTDAAAEAVVALNQARLVNGQAELAAVNLREFLATNPDAPLAVPAYGLLGTALENSRKPAEAAEAYRRAAELASVNHLKAEYLVDAGRAFVAAGRLDDAKAAYREVIAKYSGTTSITEAKVRLAELTGGELPADSAAQGSARARR